jgi:drug/metabolite transporter (DMT)-like permease
MGLVGLGWTVAGASLLPILPHPHPDSWPYLAASVAIHVGYMVGLGALYKTADLSRAYVLVRALPPVCVTAVSTLWMGERIELGAGVGIALVLAGILVVSPPRRDLWSGPMLRALIPTICTIAAYTLIDGVGARRSGSALSYALTLSLVQGLVFAAILLSRRDRQAFIAFARANVVAGLIAGLASVAAYSAILWAMTKAPLGPVAALRESSVLVASFLGAAVLRERVARTAWIGAALVFVGVLVMEVAR